MLELEKAEELKLEEEKKKKKDELFTKEEKEKVTVGLSTYINYFKFSKLGFAAPVMFASFVTCEIIYVYYTKRIGHYGNPDESNS